MPLHLPIQWLLLLCFDTAVVMTHSSPTWCSVFDEACACWTGKPRTKCRDPTRTGQFVELSALCSLTTHICFQSSIPSWMLFQQWLFFLICALSLHVVILWRGMTLDVCFADRTFLFSFNRENGNILFTRSLVQSICRNPVQFVTCC